MTKSEFRELCKLLAPKLTAALSRGMSAYALLWAIGGLESSFGAFAGQTRFELSHSRRGNYGIPDLDRLYGDASACSYGPWQIMFGNAWSVLQTVTPETMRADPFVAGEASVLFLNRQITRFNITEVRAVLDTWNTGNPGDKIFPAEHYTANGLRYYAEASETGPL